MPIRFYIIPIEPGPYSKGNGQRPMYLDALRANWSGYPLFQWNRYIVQVNTTSVKHSLLESRPGVITLPERVALDTLCGDLPSAMQNRLQVFLGNIGVAFDAAETVVSLFLRVIETSDLQTFLDRYIDDVQRQGYRRRLRTAWDPKRVYVEEF